MKYLRVETNSAIMFNIPSRTQYGKKWFVRFSKKNKRWYCNCPAGVFKDGCYHIQEAQKELTLNP